MIEHFVRHGNVITIVSVVTDPVYLTEPLVKSTDFRLNERPAGGWLWPCEYVDEVAGQKQGYVPHYLPGKSPFQGEFAKKMGIPVEATRGGAETMFAGVHRQDEERGRHRQAGGEVGPRSQPTSRRQ